MNAHSDLIREKTERLRVDMANSRDLFRGRPTERLALMIAATLVGRQRHSPGTLVWTLQAVDDLRYRLTNAKV